VPVAGASVSLVRQHLTDALHWGFFQAVGGGSRDWTFSTVSQYARAWGFRFTFAHAPEAVETFTRRDRRLKGSGSGTVTVRLPTGRRVTRSLPFEIRLPRPAGHRIRDKRHAR